MRPFRAPDTIGEIIPSSWNLDRGWIAAPLLSTVCSVEELVKVKAANRWDDEIHYRGPGSVDTTLCGMNVGAPVSHGDVTCVTCRQFASGAF